MLEERLDVMGRRLAGLGVLADVGDQIDERSRAELQVRGQAMANEELEPVVEGAENWARLGVMHIRGGDRRRCEQ